MPRRPSKTKGRARRSPPTTAYVLEQTSAVEIRQSRQHTEAVLRYHWDYYSELAFQRKRVESQLRDALNQHCISDFKFERWQRAVKYRYGLHPLCTLGSLADPGGRFNIGDLDAQNFPTFSALYIAEDKDTALQEALGQVPLSPEVPLSARELALTNPQSETIVSVSGGIDRVFDLRSAAPLKAFAELVREFELSPDLKKRAAKLGQPAPTLARSPSDILATLLDSHWRVAPQRFDIPADPQIFGHLVYLADIGGILYPSKFTSKKCLAVFPDKFAATSSVVSMDDPVPHERVPTKVDASSYEDCLRSWEQIVARSDGSL
jgi:hypothetical protein